MKEESREEKRMRGERMRMRGEMKHAMQHSTTYRMQYSTIQNNAI
jgi:hypothetical protein